MRRFKLFEEFKTKDVNLYPPANLLPNGKIDFIYRTVKQTDMFIDCYGEDMSKADLYRWCYSGKGKPTNKITTFSEIFLNPVEVSESTEFAGITSDWTIDPTYYYTVHEEVIRVCLDFKKVLEIVHGMDNVLNLLYDGEAELRLRDKIPLFKCLDHIEVVKEYYDNNVEGEYGEDRAIKEWLPETLTPFLKFREKNFSDTRKYCGPLETYYSAFYKKNGLHITKPSGFNLSGTEFFKRT